MTKTLLITGAGRGIGAATAIHASANGWCVIVNYLKNAVAAESVVDTIRSTGGIAKAIQADIGCQEDVEKLFSEIDDSFASLGGLVNNAATIPSPSKFLDTPAKEIERLIDTNLIGSMSCSREAAKRMATSFGGSGGSIVNISSEAGKFGGNGITAYAASKAAINIMTVGLAREFASESIRVNAVSPSIIDTDSNSSRNISQSDARLASLPMGRLGTTKEVAAAIGWLLSDEASYVSGAILPVTGAR